MKFGLETRHWKILERLVLQPIKENKARTYVFGSRARGDHKPFSDLDILVETQHPLPLSFLNTIKAAIEDSDFPIKVDIVDLAEMPKSYLQAVLRERVPV